MSLRQQLIRSVAEECGPRAVRFDPDARSFEAYGPGEKIGDLKATTLDQAKAEATATGNWDRGHKLLIRERGQEDAPTWPFDKQPVDRLHVFAVQRSAPLRWEFTDDLMRKRPVYRFTLKPVCTIDLLMLGAAK